jgi:4-amino-4-deoxy-L-arabinose transferase-like glycosyltransferase
MRQRSPKKSDQRSRDRAATANPAERLERRLSARTERWCVLGLLGAMVALRVLYLFEFAGAPNKSGDAEFFLDFARRIAAGDFFLRGESLIFSPFYYYFLAGVFAVVGEALPLVLSIQAGLGVLAAFLLWRLARDLFGPLSALLTLTLHVFYGLILFYEGQLMDASFSVILVAAMLLVLRRAGASGRLRDWLGGGVLLGLFVLTRPNVLPFVPLASGWAFWVSRPHGAVRGLVAAGIVVAGVAICVLPFTVRNRIVAGESMLITPHGGINFYVGNNENATGFFTPPKGMPPLPGVFNLETPRQVAEQESGRSGLSDAEVSSYWFHRGMEFVRANPDRFASLTLQRIRAYLNGRDVPINVDFDLFRDLSTALRLAFLSTGVLLPLGLVGMLRAAPAGRDHLLFILFFVSYSASVVLFFVAARYRLPVAPLLLLYGGFALRTLLADSVRPARGALTAAGLVVLLLVMNADLDLRIDPAYLAHSRGYTLETMERHDEAIVYYEQALAANPNLVLTHVHLARIFALRGDAVNAGRHYESAFRLAPEDAGVRAEVERFREYVRARR